MRKGMKALEIIFTLFVLIVVVLVVVRMFIQHMSLRPIQEPLKRWEDVNRYQAARSECEVLCENFRAAPDQLNVIKDYCTHKAAVDLNENGKTFEPKGRIVAQVPYCEDGIYCFHLYECSAGPGLTLDATACLSYLCDYYTQQVGYTAEMAMDAIKAEITPGSPACVNDPLLKIMLGGVEVTPAYWWYKAGYNSPNCEQIVTEWPGGEPQVVGFSISIDICSIDSSSLDYSCSVQAEGICNDMVVAVVDSNGNFAYAMKDSATIGSLELTTSSLSGSLQLEDVNKPLTSGDCSFTFVCNDPETSPTVIPPNSGKCSIS